MTMLSPGARVVRPDLAVFQAWAATLKSGDQVVACSWYDQLVIHRAAVKVTRTGKIYLVGLGRERPDWRKFRVDLPGGGARFIAPLDGNWNRTAESKP